MTRNYYLLELKIVINAKLNTWTNYMKKLFINLQKYEFYLKEIF